MDCLVCQNQIETPMQIMGDTTGLQLDIGTEIKAFVQANPIPTIGLALAIGYGLYMLLKSK